uniref:Uncharacterized protein n=1 Tax=Sinocyclocheilus grahami TaxID=75366 RepID=A0A672L6H2_SINGR
QDPLKKMTAKVLMSLLACSSSAQSYACKAGVIDSCVERMKHIYAKLHLESVKTGKSTHRRKVTEGSKILQNCLYQHNECKAVATELRLAAVLMALWPWFLLDDLSMTAALELLCVYTANCTVGHSSGSSGSVQAVVPKTAVTNSLMHGVMKLASQVAPDNSSIHSLAFSLLAKLAISRDYIIENNFLQHILSLPMPKAGGQSGSPAAEPLSLWLKLLLNVSFGEDRQQMILRLRGALELLVGLAQSKHSILVNGMRAGFTGLHISPFIFPFCISPLTKAKATLKCPSIRLKVEEAYMSGRKGGNIFSLIIVVPLIFTL